MDATAPIPPETADFYQELGVHSLATRDQIRKAYMDFTRQHHPDKNGDPAKFVQVQEAYDVLVNEELRPYYDQVYGELCEQWAAYHNAKVIYQAERKMKKEQQLSPDGNRRVPKETAGPQQDNLEERMASQKQEPSQAERELQYSKSENLGNNTLRHPYWTAGHYRRDLRKLAKAVEATQRLVHFSTALEGVALLEKEAALQAEENRLEVLRKQLEREASRIQEAEARVRKACRHSCPYPLTSTDRGRCLFCGETRNTYFFSCVICNGKACLVCLPKMLSV